jgi:hypothetical protein
MSKLGNCPDCGLNMDFVGRAHRCIPQPVNNAPVVNSEAALLTSSATRSAKWRKANPELNRERARNGMRKKRALLENNQNLSDVSRG